jgi:ABC-type transporter Mla maintaining outer membrane lipid asymmetry ATPase subunit MlaF
VTNQPTPASAIRAANAPRTSGAEPRIRVRGLGKHYGTLEVFRNIDFDIGEREIVAVVGPSGCGKTTLTRPLLACRCSPVLASAANCW